MLAQQRNSSAAAEPVATPQPDATAILRLRSIIETIQKPKGFADLHSDDRCYILAVILALTVPIDGKVKPVELDKLCEILSLVIRATPKTIAHAVSIAQMNLGEGETIKKITHILGRILINDRQIG